ncbi:30S ribosomal protein S21, chloroplastic, partial [Cucurbita argyrosperma subsp. argyrosperma]
MCAGDSWPITVAMSLPTGTYASPARQGLGRQSAEEVEDGEDVSYEAKLARLAAARTRSSVTSSSPESTSPILSVRNYNVLITVDNNDPEEKLVNQFRRQVLRAGILQECKRRRFFENSQAKRKRKARESAKRNRKRGLTLFVLCSWSTLLIPNVKATTLRENKFSTGGRVWKPESRAEEQQKQETTRRKDMDEGDDNWEFYQLATQDKIVLWSSIGCKALAFVETTKAWGLSSALKLSCN